MSEEFGVDGAFGNGSAVDSHVIAVLAGAEFVHDFRKKLLTHTAFAQHQHAQVCAGHLGGDVNGAVHQGRVADDAETLFDALQFHRLAVYFMFV